MRCPPTPPQSPTFQAQNKPWTQTCPTPALLPSASPSSRWPPSHFLFEYLFGSLPPTRGTFLSPRRKVGGNISPDRLGELIAEKASKITKSELSGAVQRVPGLRTRGKVPRSRTGSQRGLACSDRAGHCTVGSSKVRNHMGRVEGIPWT